MIKILTLLFLATPLFASGQSKFPPKDDSSRSRELQTFVRELKEIIKNKDSRKLLERVHPQVKFDFDDGVGIEKFRKNWKPEDKNSELWPHHRSNRWSWRNFRKE
jgi:hypothetical protein